MDLEAVITELVKQTDLGVVSAKIKEKMSGLWQMIFDKGHSTATADLQPKLKEQTDKAAKFEIDLAKANTKIEELGKQNPDVQALHKQYQEREEAMKVAHANELKTRDDALNGERLERARAEFKGMLSNVDPDYIPVVMARPEVANRFRLTKEGKLEILQLGQEIPYTEGGAISPLKALAEAIYPTVPAKFQLVDVDTGSGRREATSAGGTKTTTFDKIRKEAEDKQKEVKEVIPLEKRMNMAR